MNKQRLLLVDGFNLLSRGYFATAYGKEPEQLLKSSNGTYINGLIIFFRKIFKLVSEHEITHAAITWDVKREETTRRLKYDFYKANRGDLPEPLIEQFEVAKKVLDSIGIHQISVSHYEADDVIGTLASMWSFGNYGHCYVYSNDKDLFQLLDANTSQLIGSKKGDIIYSLDSFHNDYDITPRQWIDVKALLGDTSDNIPGCPGVGEKSALPLVQKYGSLENIMEQVDVLDKKFNRYKKKLIKGKESAIISKELSTITCDIIELRDFLFEEIELNLTYDDLIAELRKLDISI